MLNNKIRSIFICFFLLFISVIISQPRAKYRPFDWLNFRESGKINVRKMEYRRHEQYSNIAPNYQSIKN